MHASTGVPFSMNPASLASFSMKFNKTAYSMCERTCSSFNFRASSSACSRSRAASTSSLFGVSGVRGDSRVSNPSMGDIGLRIEANRPPVLTGEGEHCDFIVAFSFSISLISVRN